MIAGYIRVSSKAQDHSLQRDAIERKGVKVATWYAEKQSAKTTKRAELQRLLADARAGLISELWVFRLDRLTRSGVSDTFAVVSELRKAGVTLHTVAEGVTIRPGDDIVSDVMIFALGLAAGIERVAINDRISAARERSAVWGRPKRMTPAEVASAKKLAEKGRTVREIASALGIPRSTVGRALRAA